MKQLFAIWKVLPNLKLREAKSLKPQQAEGMAQRLGLHSMRGTNGVPVVLGAIAYIALGALRRQNRATAPIEVNGPSLWQRLFARSQPQAIPATDRDFARLHKVLYGFQVGLNR